ncbi:MAG: PAS domain S-box protein [Candidatus Thiodiazotropha weberae]|nr:PAS domain S-box protein [Candidatus Thiodiazotropha lotti]MCW4212020.1 PAS domain S-box protein [Candidatus Thiodiazotropha lotti]
MIKLELADILTAPVTTVPPNCTVDNALALMRKQRISSIVITEGQVPVGIFTERDAVIISYRHQDSEHLAVQDVMGTPPLTAPLDMDYREAYRLIADHHVRHLIIVNDQGHLAGIASESSFMQHLGTEFLVRFKEVGALMTRSVITLPYDALVDDAIRLMARDRISCVVVEDAGAAVGIFTERDLVRLSSSINKGESISLSSVMAHPVRSIPIDMPVSDAIKIMDQAHIRRLVVIGESGSIVGLVTRNNIVRQLYDTHIEHLRQALNDREQELESLKSQLQLEKRLRNTEEALKDSERRLKLALSAGGIGTWSWDIGSDMIVADSHFAKLSGIPEDLAVKGLSFEQVFDSIYEEDRDSVHGIIQECLSAGGSDQYSFDFRVIWPDESMHWLSALGEVNDRDSTDRATFIHGCLIDVSDRKEAEHALRESEKQYKNLITHSPDMMYQVGLDEKVIFVSPSIEHMTGFTPDEIIGIDAAELLYVRPEERNILLQLLNENGSVKGFEAELKRKDGTTWWASANVHYVKDENGTVQAVEGIVRDITEQKRIESLLHESEQRLRFALDRSHTGGWDLNLVDHTVHRTLKHDQIFGYDSLLPEWTYEMFLDHVIPVDRSDVDNNFNNSVDTKSDWNFECRIRRRDNEILWIRGAGGHELVKTGEIKRMSGIVQDITERKLAEAKLIESEKSLRTLLDTIPDLIWLKDPEGVYLSCNSHFQQFLDLSEERIIGKTDHDLFDPSIADAYHKNDKIVLDSGKVHMNEEDAIYADGHITQMETTKTPVHAPDGSLVGVLGIGRDITERKRAESDLTESERRFRATFDQAAVGIARVAPDGHWLEVNEKLSEIVGYSREELLEKTFQDITYPDDLDADLALVKEVLSGKRKTYSMDKRYIKSSGALVWIRLTVSLVRDDDGEPLYFISVIEDIDQRKKNAEKLIEAAAVFRSTGEGVTITDHEGNILDVNDAFTRITGYSRDEVIGRNPRVLQSGRHDKHFYEDMWHQLLENGQWHGEIWNRSKNGTVYPEILTISSVDPDDGGPKKYVGVFADISSLKATEARLDHLAHHDSLTGLPNRLLFRDRLIHSLASSERKGTKVAVVFLDLDRFKNINDTLGHGVGDQLLVEVSERITRITRAGDTVGRISGDEFCLVLEDLHLSIEVIPVVEKVLQIFADPFDVESHILRVSSSIGIALYPDNSKDADALLSFADAAMYEAKEAGRNTYCFYTREMTEQAQEHSFVQSALREAQDQSQFYLVYQPQIDLNTNNLVGLEVLSRWQHPTRGLIPPNMFIPVAEQSGLIRQLGAWILRTATTQARAWLDEGHEFGRVYVNVAGPQLHDAGFPELVKSCLTESGLPPERLGLEVTESFAMRASEHAFEVLSSLRDMGIELAIDDFGTGYSSLSYLKQLPVHKLKIDQSFVRDIPVDPNDMAIAEAVISMGRALNLKVIAEGVEKQEQAAFLYGKGCQEAQGYLYSRPLKPEQFEEWMAQTMK